MAITLALIEQDGRYLRAEPPVELDIHVVGHAYQVQDKDLCIDVMGGTLKELEQEIVKVVFSLWDESNSPLEILRPYQDTYLKRFTEMELVPKKRHPTKEFYIVAVERSHL